MRSEEARPHQQVASIPADAYALLLVCSPIDRFGYNAVFAEEISASFAAHGLSVRICDFRSDIRAVSLALNDPRCLFLLCFNGFGADLALAHPLSNNVTPAYEHFGKPIFDIMHDCPAMDTMAHQVQIRSRFRHVLVTDYGYAQDAAELGFPEVLHVPSITFPLTLAPPAPLIPQRNITILLPVQLASPDDVKARFRDAACARDRVMRVIFEQVCDVCVADIGRDVRIEARRTCHEAGLAFDVNHSDFRFLLTAVADFVKFERRRRLVAALDHLPVTILSYAPDQVAVANGRAIGPHNFTELLRCMADARVVVCPLSQMTGWHERALGAFTAGAAVVAAPNNLLEAHFRHGEEMLTYRSYAEAGDMLSALLGDPARLEAMAEAGRARAMQAFAPTRLASTILSVWRSRHAPAQAALAELR